MKRSILGPNSYLAKQRLNELLSEVDASSIEQFDGDDLDLSRLKEVVQAQSLFSAPTVIIKNISEQKSLHEDILKIIEGADTSLDLIIYEPNIDKRSKYYKSLTKDTEAEQFSNLDFDELVNWLINSAKTSQSEISRSSARHLVERVGEDQWLIASELDKLIASGEAIDNKLIDQLVEPTPRESIFKLLDAVLDGNQSLATKRYDSLIKARLEPSYILSMIVWQLHIIAIILYGKDKSPDQIAKDAKISPYVIKKTKSSTSGLSKSKLRTMLRAASDTDADIKSISIDQKEAVKQLVIKLC